MAVTVFANATLVLPDRLVPNGSLRVRDRRITSPTDVPRSQPELIDLGGMYLAPGFVDLHVHGGDGADFMDGTPEAFRAVCRCHARHGTTSLTPTSTVATGPQYDRFLALCAELYGDVPDGARIVGSHFYGAYFARPAKGCHPDQEFLPPNAENAARFTKLAETMPLAVTIAPELEGAEWFAREYAKRVQVNIGPASTGMTYVNGGRLRVLATLLPARSSLLPDVPTAAEAGFPDVKVPTWQALFAPPRTSREIANRLSQAVAEALADPAMLAQFERIGVQPAGSTPEGLEAMIREDQPAWVRFIRENGIEAE
jgi:hypothetical protein